MKISNSKKQLAKIISENGGWPDAAEFAVQGRETMLVGFSKTMPYRRGCGWFIKGETPVATFKAERVITNWHQTILSRDEYFHLYPAVTEVEPDIDGWVRWEGGECPVEVGTIVDVKQRDGDFGARLHAGKETYEPQSEGAATAEDWSHGGSGGDIIAYRLHKPWQSIEQICSEVTEQNKHAHADAAPTIESLAADYRAKLAIAKQAQEEADSHRCGAEAALEKLVASGKALGLIIGIVKDDPVKSELNITDWRDLRVGDVVEGRHYSRAIIGEVIEIDEDCHDNRPLRILEDGGQPWWVTSNEVKFIRRP